MVTHVYIIIFSHKASQPDKYFSYDNDSTINCLKYGVDVSLVFIDMARNELVAISHRRVSSEDRGSSLAANSVALSIFVSKFSEPNLI